MTIGFNLDTCMIAQTIITIMTGGTMTSTSSVVMCLRP